MKTIIMLLEAGSLQTLCVAQNIYDAEPYLTKSLSAADISGVEKKTSGGGIRNDWVMQRLQDGMPPLTVAYFSYWLS